MEADTTNLKFAVPLQKEFPMSRWLTRSQ